MKEIFKILLCVLSLSGCASIMRDGSQIVPIQSNVEDVSIEVTNSQGAVVYKGISICEFESLESKRRRF